MQGKMRWPSASLWFNSHDNSRVGKLNLLLPMMCQQVG